MKFSIISIIVLTSIVWNIAFTDFAIAMPNNLPFKLEQVQNIAAKTDQSSFKSSNKEIHWDFFYEEITENEEEIQHEFISYFLINYLIVNQAPILEETQHEIINDSLPPITRLFIKLCSLKIPHIS